VSSTLASNFAAWHCVLNDHFLPINDAELDKAFSDDDPYTKEQVLLSWQRIFDLKLCIAGEELENGDFEIQDGYDGATQITFPSIKLEYVKRVKAFKGR